MTQPKKENKIKKDKEKKFTLTKDTHQTNDFCFNEAHFKLISINGVLMYNSWSAFLI